MEAIFEFLLYSDHHEFVAVPIVVLVMAEVFVVLYSIEMLIRGNRGQQLKLRPSISPGARRLLLLMVLVQKASARYGFVGMLFVIWLVLAQGSDLSKLAALGLVIGGVTIQRMIVSHRPLLRLITEGKQNWLEAGTAPITEVPALRATAPMWRRVSEKPWELFSKHQVAWVLVVINGLLVWLLYL